MKKTIAVLHFGGTTLGVTVASRGLGGAFVVHARSVREYGGIISGEFVDSIENLAVIVIDAIREVQRSVKVKIDKLFIGTPHSFCNCDVISEVLNLSRPRKITEKDTYNLVQAAGFFDSSRTVINRSAVFYRLDDGRAIIDAAESVAKKVEARVSLITTSNYFVDVVKFCLSGSGFRRIEFISVALAEGLYFIEEEVRDHTAVMISCSMFSTTVSVCCGDGLMFLQSFEQGIAHVINDVSIVLGTNFAIANSLVNEAVVSVRTTENDNYEIMFEGQKKKFGAALVNDIIKSRMELMADHIVRLFVNADQNLLSNNPIFICGGNLDAVGGARDFFGKAIGAHITGCVCPLTKQNTGIELVINALLNMALTHEK